VNRSQNKIVVQFLRAPLGGIRKHIVSIIEALENSEEWDWYWVTSTAEEDIDEGFKRFLAEKPERRERIINLKINDRPEWRDVKNIFQLFFKLRKHKKALFHGHGAKGGLYARVLGLFLGAKTLYTPHGGSLHDMFGRLIGGLYSIIEKGLYPLTSLFVFESRYSKEQFHKKVNRSTHKTMLNQNGIALPDREVSLKARSEGQPWILGSFGALRFIKGHDLVLGALPLLNEKGIACEYHIYGEGEERANLLKLAQKLGAQDQFHLHEKTQDVLGAMQACDLVLQPSRHESFGYVPLEAMSVKRPVIASHQGGLKEVVRDGHTGLLVKELTAKAFAEAIEKMIKETEKREEMVEKAYDSLQDQFSEERQLRDLLAAYSRVARH
jgi:glycosyltransferase involved in cell wall biosynthesis